MRAAAVGGVGVILLLVLLARCGDTAAPTGDVEGQVLGMPSTTQQPVALAGAAVLIAGNRIECGTRADNCVAETDAGGTYHFADVPTGDYGLLFVYDDPTFAEGKPLDNQGREVNVSKDGIETVSVVLLPEGVEPPPIPAGVSRDTVPPGGYRGGGGGITNNPFFWLWMFDRPYAFGYHRPPVVIAPRSGGPVTSGSSLPSSSSTGRQYTRYGSSGASGTKATPKSISAKGVTRPGAAAVSTGSRTSTARGVTRPGAAAINSSTRSSWSNQVSRTVRPPARVGGLSVRSAGSSARGGGPRIGGK
ncbi:MAG: hypothetical protein CL878_05065 [Dehalococcoidia bacterium]|nr:hypothetical protein [Dehalococcoidia bacterium]